MHESCFVLCSRSKTSILLSTTNLGRNAASSIPHVGPTTVVLLLDAPLFAPPNISLKGQYVFSCSHLPDIKAAAPC